MASAQSNSLCRSELARDGLKDDAFIQTKRVNVDVHREQARSYKSPFLHNPMCQSNTPKVM
jgi:hypothetical protein